MSHRLKGRKQSPEHVEKRRLAQLEAFATGAKTGWPAGVPKTPENKAKVKAGIKCEPTLKPSRVWTTCQKCGKEFKTNGNPDQKHCSRACAYTGRSINTQGYVTVPDPTKKSRRVLEHRKVMEEIIGRPLVGIENVHHRNGDKTDNRPENLELRKFYQPPGQRPEEILDRIRQIREKYGHLRKPKPESSSS